MTRITVVIASPRVGRAARGQAPRSNLVNVGNLLGRKPLLTSVMAFGRQPPAWREAGDGLASGRRLRRPRRLAAEAVGGEGVQILAPALVALDAELVEIGPGIDAGVVQIVEDDAHGIVADRLQRDDPDMGAPGVKFFWPGPWPCTSADGLSTRRYSAGRRKRRPSSKLISSSFSACLRRSSIGQRAAPPPALNRRRLMRAAGAWPRPRRRAAAAPRRPA